MTRRARLAAILCGVAIGFGALPASQAQDDADLRAALVRMAGDLPAMEARFALRFKSLPASHLRLLAEHTRELLTNDDFADMVISLSGPMAAAGVSTEEIVARSAEVGVEMQVRGLARLPSDRQEEFLRYSTQMFGWLSDNDVETCKALTVATPMPSALEMQRVEYEFLATQPVDQVDAILTLYRDATLAELRKVEGPVALTDAQRDAAMFAYSNRLMDSVREQPLPTLSLETLDLANASASDVCRFTVMSMEAVFELTGNERVWLVQEFVDAMDEPL